jgi:hypothetical protein
MQSSHRTKQNFAVCRKFRQNNAVCSYRVRWTIWAPLPIAIAAETYTPRRCSDAFWLEVTGDLRQAFISATCISHLQETRALSRLTHIWGRSDADMVGVTVPAPSGAASSFPVRPTTVRGAPQLYHAKWQALKMRWRKPTRKTQRGLRAHGGNRFAAGHTPFGANGTSLGRKAHSVHPAKWIWESSRPNTKDAWCRDFWIATWP